ncbi:LysR family transcriptional regulator [Streptomyces sp. Qhu-G9]|nr:LysR family transcriptional regulator [Streptomyces aurantiacus]WAU86380.1 LysR family transcriptional regulator [Streptomyces aurantiacus]
MRLYVAQPSLSQQIRALEKELGANLLERGRHGITLTPARRIFLLQAPMRRPGRSGLGSPCGRGPKGRRPRADCEIRGIGHPAVVRGTLALLVPFNSPASARLFAPP